MNENSAKSRCPKRKAILISIICTVVGIPLIIIPLVTVIVYETIFGARYETASWLEFSVSDYEGLCVERSDFYEDNGTQIAGYKYSRTGEAAQGVVIVAHGLGGGGHNRYMPFIDYFTRNGYYVFTYDVKGNDNSEGRSVEGLPQGVIDLNLAIEHAQGEYGELPIMLFGHSWGAYSVGNVLALHPEVKGAVIVAGFNESEDMLLCHSKRYVGALTEVLFPYVELYERIKFGSELSSLSALDGLKSTEARIMIVHSKDDETVPVEYGYDKFYNEFANNERFEFVLYEDKGHSYLFYSDEAFAYREGLNAQYKEYVEQNGKKYNESTKSAFMEANLDKKKCFEPDETLMSQIIEMYNEACS